MIAKNWKIKPEDIIWKTSWNNINMLLASFNNSETEPDELPKNEKQEKYNKFLNAL